MDSVDAETQCTNKTKDWCKIINSIAIKDV